jgi:hypothetical protein
MKTIDPLAGLRLFLLSPYLHLTFIIGYFFMLAKVSPNSQGEYWDEKLKFTDLSTTLLVSNIVAFVFLVTAGICSKCGHSWGAMTFELLTFMGFMVVFIYIEWAISDGKLKCDYEKTD